MDGQLTEEIGEKLERSRAFVQRWVYAYRDCGLEAIKIRKPPGRKPLLPRDRWDELRGRLAAGPCMSANCDPFHNLRCFHPPWKNRAQNRTARTTNSPHSAYQIPSMPSPIMTPRMYAAGIRTA